MVRLENESDLPAIRKVNEAAFGRRGEADLIDALRAVADPFVSLVAERDGEVVGHISFSPVSIESAEDSFTAIGLAPMSVLPEYQNQGVGSQLVEAGLAECRRLGYEVVVVLGHPAYYPRFGFVPASKHGLTCEYPVPDDTFMVVELTPGALNGKRGLVKYHPAFAEV